MSDVNTLKELRDETGLSFDKIKKALDDVGGDKTRALELLRSQAGQAAEKKADREVHEGHTHRRKRSERTTQSSQDHRFEQEREHD